MLLVVSWDKARKWQSLLPMSVAVEAFESLEMCHDHKPQYIFKNSSINSFKIEVLSTSAGQALCSVLGQGDEEHSLTSWG